MLLALPCITLFVAGGAQLMVALMTSIAFAIPIFFAWEEAFLLTLAAGTQTVIWARGLAG